MDVLPHDPRDCTQGRGLTVISWHFLFLSTTDWDAPQFGSRQQIALHLARRGHRILFVEVPRSLHSCFTDPTGTKRAIRRLGQWRKIAEGIVAYTPFPVFPLYYCPLTNALNQRLLLRYLHHLLTAQRWQLDVLWTYWPNTAPLVAKLGERFAVYHCIDDFAAAGYPLTRRHWVADMERDLCRKVDLVLARTEELAAARRRDNPSTFLLAGGVDTDLFDPLRVSRPHPEIADLPSPRAGFVGTLDDRVDIELLVRCAQKLHDVTFVLLGPQKRHRVDSRTLESLPNVVLLPPCPHDQVPAILAGFDVCLIPYLISPYTRSLSPIKLYEYLAMGKPVVGTDLPYLHREEARIIIAHSQDEFIAGVAAALRETRSSEKAAWRRQAALNQSWEAQVDEIERLLAVRMKGRYDHDYP